MAVGSLVGLTVRVLFFVLNDVFWCIHLSRGFSFFVNLWLPADDLAEVHIVTFESS